MAAPLLAGDRRFIGDWSSVIYGGGSIAIVLSAFAGCLLFLGDPMAVVLLALGGSLLLSVCAAVHCGRASAARIPALASIVAMSMVGTNWPLRLSFRVSRDSFDRLTNEIETGKQPALPARVGFFVVRDYGANRHGVLRFWTDDDPGGPKGFVRCPLARVRSEFNTWECFALDKEWQAVIED